MANSKVVLGDGTVLIDLTGDTVSSESLLSGVTAHSKTGEAITGTCAYDSDTSGDTASASEILSGKTAHARGAVLSGTMTNNEGVTGTISTKAEEYTVPQGYHDGSGKVSISSVEQAKLIATNIREGITILGVEGAMSGSEGVVAQELTATPTFSEQVISPDSDHNYLTQVTVNPINVTYTENSAGGTTVTIGAS